MADDFDFSSLEVTEAAWPVPPPKRSEVARAIKRQQDRRRRERMCANGPMESFTLTEIAERDEWMCGLCTDPVDPVRRRPDPRAPSIDHVRAVAEGGTHTRDNVRLTHWGCNHGRNSGTPLTTVDEAEKRRAALLRIPGLQALAELLNPEHMIRSSQAYHSPENYRARLARRIERYEREGR